MISSVVSTPTSEVIRTSSKLSNTSTSTLLFPKRARPNFVKKDFFVFSKPFCSLALGSINYTSDSFWFTASYVINSTGNFVFS